MILEITTAIVFGAMALSLWFDARKIRTLRAESLAERYQEVRADLDALETMIMDAMTRGTILSQSVTATPPGRDWRKMEGRSWADLLAKLKEGHVGELEEESKEVWLREGLAVRYTAEHNPRLQMEKEIRLYLDTQGHWIELETQDLDIPTLLRQRSRM